jgi:hypothetical protein
MTMYLSLEMLSPSQIEGMSDELEEMFDLACEGNDIANEEMTGKDVVELGREGMAALFAGMYKGKLSFVFAIQFTETNGHKGADLIAMAGKKLLLFKAAYWSTVVEWLKMNGIEFLDVYTPNSRADMYTKKFGFNKSCAYMRMNLD